MAASVGKLQRYQGSFVGGVVGDCIGGVFEGLWGSLIGVEKILKLCVKIEAVSNKPKEGDEDIEETVTKKPKQTWTFTDDTAMARSVAKSLIEHNSLNVRDVARKFTFEYCKEPGRGYGAGVVTVFQALKQCDCLDTFGPASRQFDGQGSYGNGGSMRIGPAGVFAHKKNMDFDSLKTLTEQITLVTHSHCQAIQGAVLQCYCVELAMELSPDFNIDSFIDKLLEKMKPYENITKCEEKAEVQKTDKTKKDEDCADSDDDFDDEHMTYCDKLELIREMAQRDTQPSNFQVNIKLGTDISAFRSMPTALYCFLRATKDIDGIENRNAFERTIIYAISLGGDTDTIATMAGAIAGACYGVDDIPLSWQQGCEGVNEALSDAEKMFDLPDSNSPVTKSDDQAD